TTTAMLEAMLRQRFTTWKGGNIGRSLLMDLPNIAPDHLVVLELSSYMLEHLRAMRWSPQLAIVTQIADDHAEWHGGHEAYVNAKRAIFAFQGPQDLAIAWEGSPAAMRLVAASPGRKVALGIQGRRPFALRVCGEHNQLNAQAAFA